MGPTAGGPADDLEKHCKETCGSKALTRCHKLHRNVMYCVITDEWCQEDCEDCRVTFDECEENNKEDCLEVMKFCVINGFAQCMKGCNQFWVNCMALSGGDEEPCGEEHGHCYTTCNTNRL